MVYELYWKIGQTRHSSKRHSRFNCILGLDHNFSKSGPPIVFETMIFGHDMKDENGNELEYQTRCSTYEEALKMHEEALNQFPQLMKMKAFW
jgi:hypothetical protein